MAVSKGRALSATINSATSLIKSSIDGTVTTSTLEQSAQQYANAAALPSVGNTFGEMALVQSTNRMYVWNGSGWYNVALINTNPVFTTSPAAEYAFDGDSPRNNITITVAASDPESLGVSFSFETGGSMDSMASVTQDSSVFTLVPKGNDSLTDGVTLTGSLTIKATDGVNIVPAVSSFTLTFITTIFDTAETQVLMKATGTGDNNTFLDGSTSNHTVTRSGDTEQHAFSPYRPGGYSMKFDGSNDYLEYPNHADFQFGTGDFTVEAWVYPTVIPGGSNNYNADMTVFGHFGSPTMFFYLDHTSLTPTLWNGSTSHSSSLKCALNQWTHIAFVRQSSTLKTYVNGRLGGTTNSYTTNFNSSTAPSTGKSLTHNNRMFKGFIADLRVVKGTAVYTSEFDSPTEKLTAVTNTKLLMGGPGFRDSIPGITWNHHPSVYGPVMRAFSPYDKNGVYATTDGGSALFDGSGDYLQIADNADFDLPGEFAYEFWLYRTGSTSGTYQAILGSNGSGSNGLTFYITQSNGALNIFQSSFIISGSAGDITNDSWHHVLLMRDSSNLLQLFIDGDRVSSSTNNTTFTDNTAGGGTRIGYDISANGYFKGFLSDIRLVKGSTGGYSSGAYITVPTAPLTAVTNTKLLLKMTNAKVFDASQSRRLMSFAGDADSPVASSGQQHFGENTIFFDGTGDYIVMDQPIEGLEDHTHEAWVYPTAGHSTLKSFFSSAPDLSGGGDNSGAGITVGEDQAFGPNNQGGGMSIAFNPHVPDNEWSHVVLQRQSGAHSLYRNGVLQGTSSTAVNFDTDYLRMASRYKNTTAYMFGGYIHDFRISKGLARYPYISKPVTLTQTNSGMTKPDGTTPTATASNTKLLAFTTSTITNDASASNHTLTSAGSSAAEAVRTPAAGMHSVYIPNGDTDIISAAASADHQIYGGDYTVEAWLYVTSFNSHGYWISKGGNTTREWGFGVTAAGLTTYWNTTGSGGAGDSSFIPAVTNRTHEWFHVAFTKSSNTLTTFKNGNIIGSGTFTSIYGGNGSLKIGRLMDYTGIAHSFNGYISNLRIIKGEAIYSKDFTPATTALKA